MKEQRRGLMTALLFGVFCIAYACGENDGEQAAQSDEKGRSLYMRNGCAVCHGDEGRGDGRLATTLRPPPRDFADATAYKKGSDAESIARTIGKGLAGTSMPAFAHISQVDRMAIARFIVQLQSDQK